MDSVILHQNGRRFPQIRQPFTPADNTRALFLIHGGPLAHRLPRGGLASRLPGTRQSVLNGGDNFSAGDIAPALGRLNFEQAHYLTGGQVGV
jgi:hypothetical protein